MCTDFSRDVLCSAHRVRWHDMWANQTRVNKCKYNIFESRNRYQFLQSPKVKTIYIARFIVCQVHTALNN